MNNGYIMACFKCLQPVHYRGYAGKNRNSGVKAMKKLPIGIQNFPEIRNGSYVYIDKTGIALDLAEKGKYYFLSRPRRFL